VVKIGSCGLNQTENGLQSTAANERFYESGEDARGNCCATTNRQAATMSPMPGETAQINDPNPTHSSAQD